MNCAVLAELKSYFLENIPGIAAFVVSLLSLLVSWKAYKRDDPKLLLNIYAGETWGGIDSGKPVETGLVITIVNIGKAPIKLGVIGGRVTHYFWKKLISKILRSLTPSYLEPREFMLDDIDINKLIFPNRIPAIVPPGDRLITIINDPRGTTLGQVFANHASSVHISDVVGNRYQLSRAAHSALKRKYKKSDSKKV